MAAGDQPADGLVADPTGAAISLQSALAQLAAAKAESNRFQEKCEMLKAAAAASAAAATMEFAPPTAPPQVQHTFAVSPDARITAAMKTCSGRILALKELMIHISPRTGQGVATSKSASMTHRVKARYVPEACQELVSIMVMADDECDLKKLVTRSLDQTSCHNEFRLAFVAHLPPGTTASIQATIMGHLNELPATDVRRGQVEDVIDPTTGDQIVAARIWQSASQNDTTPWLIMMASAFGAAFNAAVGTDGLSSQGELLHWMQNPRATPHDSTDHGVGYPPGKSDIPKTSAVMLSSYLPYCFVATTLLLRPTGIVPGPPGDDTGESMMRGISDLIVEQFQYLNSSAGLQTLKNSINSNYPLKPANQDESGRLSRIGSLALLYSWARRRHTAMAPRPVLAYLIPRPKPKPASQTALVAAPAPRNRANNNRSAAPNHDRGGGSRTNDFDRRGARSREGRSQRGRPRSDNRGNNRGNRGQSRHDSYVDDNGTRWVPQP